MIIESNLNLQAARIVPIEMRASLNFDFFDWVAWKWGVKILMSSVQ